MRFRVTEFTWIHTSIFAVATAFVATACDEAGAIDEEELAVESLDEEDTPEAAEVDAEADPQADELAAPDAEAPEAVDERRRRDDDDDGWGRRRKKDDDDDGWGRRRRKKDDDDGWGRRRKKDDDDDGWH